MLHTAKTGDEYHAKCNHLSHTLVHCLTSPGAGENLYWQITVLKQTSMISINATTSYAPPLILSSLSGEISTHDFSKPIQLEGANFGITDTDDTPVNTFVEIHHNNKIVTKNIDMEINEAGIPNSFVKEYGRHIIAFFPLILGLH